MDIFKKFKNYIANEKGSSNIPLLEGTPMSTKLEDALVQISANKSNHEYAKEVLPNGKTIAEQQQEDLKMAQGEYSEKTPVFCDMKIVSSTITEKENYARLNEDEQMFFSAFRTELIKAKYTPCLVKLTRLSGGGFDVDYIGLCYIGKIDLYQKSETYMQYMIGMTSVKELHNPSLQQCIDTIPRWVRYLNYCKRN